MHNALKKITTRAKQLRKKQPGISWKSAIKKAGAEYRTGKKSKYRQTGKSNIKADLQRSARLPGPRKPRGGKKVTYHERRKNRSDVPGKLTGTAYNEMILRNLRTNNSELETALSRLKRLQEECRNVPRSEKRTCRSKIKDQKKYIASIKHNIRMLRVLIK